MEAGWLRGGDMLQSFEGVGAEDVGWKAPDLEED